MMTKNLWQPPRLCLGGDSKEEDRHATWLELFYDLIYVAAIGELAHNLSEDVSLLGFVGFVALFVPIWWSWVGATFYTTRFDSNDLGHQLLTLLQMAGVAVLAVNVHHGLGESSTGFALSYVAVRAVTTFQYLRAGHHIPIARPLTTRFAFGFVIAAGLWLVSLFVPTPWRFGLWAVGIVIDLGTPRFAGQLLTQFPLQISHVQERLGLFTIIVLGESVLAVVRGTAQQQWGLLSAVAALLGLSIAFSLWWLYFDSVDGSPLRAGRNIGFYWLYAHLALVIGLTALGVGVEYVVSSEPGKRLPQAEQWLLCGPVALCLLVLAFIHLITHTLGAAQYRKILAVYRIGAAAFVLVLAVAGGDLLPVVLIAVVAAACAVQVFWDLLRVSYR